MEITSVFEQYCPRCKKNVIIEAKKERGQGEFLVCVEKGESCAHCECIENLSHSLFGTNM